MFVVLIKNRTRKCSTQNKAIAVPIWTNQRRINLIRLRGLQLLARPLLRHLESGVTGEEIGVEGGGEGTGTGEESAVVESKLP